MEKVGPTGQRVARRLNEVRRERGYTLAALVEKLATIGRPIQLSTLSKIETGDRRVDVDDLVALANVLDVSPNSLLLETDAEQVVLTPTRTLSLDQAWRWALLDQPPVRPRSRIFISYHPADKAWGAWIARQLVDAGHDVSIDSWDLDRAACVIAVASANHRGSLRAEIGPDRRAADLPILGVIIDGSATPEDFPPGWTWIRFDHSTEQDAADALRDAVDAMGIPRPLAFEEAGFPRARPGGFRLDEPAPPVSGMPAHRAIVAVDIHGWARRTVAAQARLRRVLYELLDGALRSSGIIADDLQDRGDGFVVLIPPHDEAPKYLLINTFVPALSALLAKHNSREPGDPLRLRVTVHAGEVYIDRRGAFGESVNAAMRLLSAPELNAALRDTAAPLALVVSEDIYRSVVRHGYEGIDARTFTPEVTVKVGDESYRGWVHVSQ